MNGSPGPIRVEYLRDALGVGVARPRLSWTPVDGAVEGYELVVIQGAEATLVVCGPEQYRFVDWPGAALRSRSRAEAKVRALGAGGPGPWGAPVAIEAGLLADHDWTARFVTSDVDGPGTAVLRRRFEIDGEVGAGRLYATFRGIGQVRLNGEPVGDEVLAPGWHSYPHRLLVSTFDVTAQLRAGMNVLEVRLADGWYRGKLGFTSMVNVYGDDLSALLQLEYSTLEGRVGRVETDEGWRWTPGPSTAASLYDGESYDARLEPADNEAGWTRVRVSPVPAGLLSAPLGPPVRRIETVAPRSLTRDPAGRTLVDFGQNLVGWLRLRVDAPAGTTITLRHAEVLEHGELATRPLRDARATDRYIADGAGPVSWEPAFTYHGFRYAEIEGWPGGGPSAADIDAVVAHSDMRRIGRFSTSNQLLDRLHRNVVWSMRGNFVSLPTDCPQRDERLGWTGDIAVFAPTATYLYDCVGLLRSWLEDLKAEQDPRGFVPYFVPTLTFPPELAEVNPVFHPHPTAVWGDAATLVPFALYEATGDADVLAAQYDSMRAWVDGVAALAGPGRVWDEGFQFGDWLDPAAPPDDPAAGRTAPDLVATAYFAHSARLVARAAGILGRPHDAARYGALADEVVAAFRSRFVLADGRLSSDSQTAYAVALELRLLDDDQRRVAGRRLVSLVREAGHLIGTGFVGTPLILDALADAGAIDDAYELLLQTAVPSWGYAVEMGATTIWERWDSMLPDGSVNPGEMTSFNHYAFGAVAAWLHSTVAGIRREAPGYDRVRIAPRPHPEVLDAMSDVETPHGLLAVRWHVADAQLTVEADIPPGVSATIDLEGTDPTIVGPGRHMITVPYRRRPRFDVQEGSTR